ncbi:hypothetical protein POTOM_031004 [Populus tomentosa]|uniref:ATP synthase subunit d, mitochondrial n=1 Tax=Populus tomentosa TaxID=118781 RepID=A0A8X7ZBV8_POPTO|nr:hypothetical protein POTOM_031004 [Populus tomentosa]
MSGPSKKVVDVAFKASRTIDWDGMAKLLVSDEARKEFATLRRAFNEEPEPIDWEYYRRGIGSRLVDMYKQAYESIEIPKFQDKVTPEYKPKFDQLVRANSAILIVILVELKEAEQQSLKESERLEKEIAEVQELKTKISTMTAEEYFEKHPELKKKFDDEIRNDYWGY